MMNFHFEKRAESNKALQWIEKSMWFYGSMVSSYGYRRTTTQQNLRDISLSLALLFFDGITHVGNTLETLMNHRYRRQKKQQMDLSIKETAMQHWWNIDKTLMISVQISKITNVFSMCYFLKHLYSTDDSLKIHWCNIAERLTTSMDKLKIIKDYTAKYFNPVCCHHDHGKAAKFFSMRFAKPINFFFVRLSQFKTNCHIFCFNLLLSFTGLGGQNLKKARRSQLKEKK